MAGPDSTATYNQEQRERLESEMMDLVKKGKQTPESLLKHFFDKGSLTVPKNLHKSTQTT